MENQERAAKSDAEYLLVADSAFRSILEAARGAFPRECFGVLLGNGKLVSRARKLANLADRPDRFEADPREMLKVEQEASGAGMEVIGYFHSHPGGSAEPSCHDVAGKVWPDLPPCYHIIVAVLADRTFRVAGYDTRQSPWRRLRIRVVSDGET